MLGHGHLQFIGGGFLIDMVIVFKINLCNFRYQSHFHEARDSSLFDIPYAKVFIPS